MLETGSIMTVYLVVNGTLFDLLENGSIKASNMLETGSTMTAYLVVKGMLRAVSHCPFSSSYLLGL